MARDWVTVASCDGCAAYTGAQSVPAKHERLVAGSEGLRRIDLCDHCNQLPIWAWLAAIYDHGVDIVDRSKSAKSSGEPTKKAAIAGAPKALEAAPAQPEPESVKKKRGPNVVCPLAHRSAGDTPTVVAYAYRGQHAQIVHNLRMSQVRWEDPEGVLQVSCDAHEECVENNVKFTSQHGRTQHINNATLPRIGGQD